MTDANKSIMVLVHPGSACGSADFNLGDDAAPLRDALANEIVQWTDDILILDGELSDELEHYAALGLAIHCTTDRQDRRVVRQRACALTMANWVEVACRRFEHEWPGGPHDVVLTGAWTQGDRNGCIDAMVDATARHRTRVSERALHLP